MRQLQSGGATSVSLSGETGGRVRRVVLDYPVSPYLIFGLT